MKKMKKETNKKAKNRKYQNQNPKKTKRNALLFVLFFWFPGCLLLLNAALPREGKTRQKRSSSFLFRQRH
jgi:hypothetical protein